MRIHCWSCRKAVSSELSEGAIFRGVAYCPECIEKGLDVDSQRRTTVAPVKDDTTNASWTECDVCGLIHDRKKTRCSLDILQRSS